MWDKEKFLFCLMLILWPLWSLGQVHLSEQEKFFYEKGRIFVSNAQYDSATIYLKKALEGVKKGGIWEKKLNADLLDIQAEVFRLDQKYPLAENYLQLLLKMKIEMYSANDSLVAEVYHKLGVVQREGGRIQESLRSFEEALKIKQDILPSNAPSIGMSYNGIMNTLRELGKFEEAIDYGQKALEINQKAYGENSLDVAQNLHNLALVYRRKGKYIKAKNLLYQSLDIKQALFDSIHVEIGDAYYGLATVAMDMGDYGLALSQLLKAQYIYQTLSSPQLLQTQVFLGIIYGEKGDYERAIGFHQLVMDKQLPILGTNHLLIAGILNNISICELESRQYEKSLRTSLKALEIQQKLYGESHIEIAGTYSNIGKAYLGKRDTLEAEKYFLKALKTAQEEQGLSNPDVGTIHQAVGKFYLTKGDNEKALLHYNKGIQIYKELNIENHPDIARAYQQLARMHLKLGEIQKALENLQHSFRIMGVPYTSPPPSILPRVSHTYSKGSLLEIFGLWGEIWYGKYTQTSDNQDLDYAARAFTLAVNLVDSIRLSYRGKNSKLILAEKAQGVFLPAIQVSKVAYEKTGSSESLDHLFFLIEKSKAAWLNDALQEMETKKFSGIPAKTLMKEEELKMLLNHSIEQLFQAENRQEKEQVIYWRQERFIVRRKLDSLLASIEHQFPKYHQLRYGAQLPSRLDVQKTLNENSLMIDYYIAGRTLLMLCMTSKKVHLIERLLPSKYEDDIDSFLKSINQLSFIRQEPQKADSIYLTQAYSWYELAVAPALEWAGTEIDQLVLIPHGLLGYVPFDALLLEEIEPPLDYRRLPYLLTKYKVSRRYTSNFLIRPQINHGFTWQPKGFAGFAPGYETLISENTSSFTVESRDGRNRLSIGRLPGAKKEVQEIQSLMGGEKWIGQAATKTEFLSHASSYSLLHLAMHGILDHVNPNYSYLLFDPQGESHRLYASELYNLDLEADMIVLSACNSGTGNLMAGEGIMSLSHAFTYAGASALVMTLWSVADETTSQIMELFYQNLKSNQPKDIALREAKLDYLSKADPLYARPFFWAAFVPMGDMTPISPPSRLVYWIGGILFVCLSVIIIFASKRYIQTKTTNDSNIHFPLDSSTNIPNGK